MKKRMFQTAVIISALLPLAACQFNRDGKDQMAYHHVDESPHQKHKDLAKAARLNVQLGLSYMKTGKMQRAKQKLLTAISQAPKSALVYDAMAYYKEITGNLSDANDLYEKALSLEPNNGTPLNNYGGFLCRQKRYQESLAYFIKATEDPSYLKVADAYENAGLCALKVPNKAKARAYFIAAMKNDPSRTLSLYELSVLDYQEGNLKQAAARMDNYFRLTPPGPSTTLLAYKINKRLGRVSDAVKYSNIMQKQFANTKQYEQFRQFRGSRLS